MTEAKDHPEDMPARQFTLEHFKDMLEKMAKPGLMQKFMMLMPGMDEIRKMMDGNDGALPKMIGLINSMTPTERKNPKLIDVSRHDRIARGAGVAPAMATQLITQFTRLQPIMQIMAGGGDRMAMMKQLQQSMLKDPTLGDIKKKGRRDRGDWDWDF